MKKIITAVFGIVMSLGMAFTSFAGDFVVKDASINAYRSVKSWDTEESMKSEYFNWFSECDEIKYSNQHKRNWCKIGSKYYCSFDGTDLANREKESSYVSNWLTQNMPSVVPDGTDRFSAIENTYNWIASNMSYDHEAVNAADKTTIVREQSPCTGFMTGKGICTTYAQMFMAMIKSIRLNDAGIVDYKNGNNKIEVADIFTSDHEWNAVKTDGVWYYYDICNFDESNGSKEFVNAGESLLDGNRLYSGEKKWIY